MLVFALLIIFITLSVGLAWFLIAHDRGQKEPVAALWIALGFGFLGAIVAAVAEVFLLNDKNLRPGVAFPTVFGTAIGIGLIEEVCKFVPLALFIFKKPYFNEHTDGVLYFAIAGMGFGLPENLLYTLQFGSQAGVGRILLTPFFHAATTALVGYFLARRKLAKRSMLGIWPMLLAAAVLHGVYDFGLSTGSAVYGAIAVLITFGLSAALFLLYLQATERDEDLGLSVVGVNNYCRSCGSPNPQHHLYCTQCGKNA